MDCHKNDFKVSHFVTNATKTSEIVQSVFKSKAIKTRRSYETIQKILQHDLFFSFEVQN